MSTYGNLVDVKSRLGSQVTSSDAYDVDLTQKLEDACDYIIMRLEEYPSVFPDPDGLTGSDKVRLDRITNDLAAAEMLEDRSMRARMNTSPEYERWSIVFRRRATLELDQFIKVKSTGQTGPGEPDFVKIRGTSLGGDE